ncbi:MAG: choice-of-anchor I family protein [Bryobacter sp.]|nr:choice-of-anchor I family protein [Bryobacter sp.]
MKRSILALTLLCVQLGAQSISLSPLGSYRDGAFDEGAAEIVAHDPATHRLFVVNGGKKSVDILDARDPMRITRISTLEIPAAAGDAPNSVAVNNGIVAVAMQAAPATNPGFVAFFRAADGVFLKALQVGSLPDMVTFTPDGTKVLTANEGEPSDDWLTDPEGTVSIIDVSKGIDATTQADVRTADFRAFTVGSLPAGVRIFGPANRTITVANNVEPEYIAVTPDSRTAYVTLQENNAVAVVNLETATVTSIRPLGTKAHWLEGNAMDASDRDGGIQIRQWTVWGMYQPDTIAGYTAADGNFYLVTANEGDARDYDAFSEEARVADLNLDPRFYPDPTGLKQAAELGRLTVTNATGDDDGDGDIDRIHAFGARSFSIWDANARLVYDSGNALEQAHQADFPLFFNVSNSNNTFENRSDDKGPEPEAIAIGTVNGRTYAFIGNERQSNIVVYDITDPANSRYVGQWWNRDFRANVQTAAAGDLGPEGIIFISAENSPNGRPLLVVANEISGTTTIWQIN